VYENKEQRQFARNLRKNITDAEVRLWMSLRAGQLKGFKFRRQAAIGRYIVDFVCFPAKIIIEVDGSQHGEPENQSKDVRRTAWLESQGFQVLRFWNHEVMEDLEEFVELIWRKLQRVGGAGPPSPAFPTEGREQERPTKVGD
jgi:very-short-patch-repair endonuclease